jgi:hypothetical protein
VAVVGASLLYCYTASDEDETADEQAVLVLGELLELRKQLLHFDRFTHGKSLE